MKIREDKGKVNLDFLNFYPSIFLLMENKKKVNTFTFRCLVITLGPYLVYT